MEAQFVAKGRVTTPILFYMVGFKKVMRGRKKKHLQEKKYWLVLNYSILCVKAVRCVRGIKD